MSSVFVESAQHNLSSGSTSVDINTTPARETALESHKLIDPIDSMMITQSSFDAVPIDDQLNSSTLTDHPSLSTIPYELRDKIFKDCIELVGGKTPSLMIALRCNKKLYPQALELYRKINFFTLDGITKETVKKLSPTAVAKIRNLCNDNRDGSLAGLYRILPWPFWSEPPNIRTPVVLSGGSNCLIDCLWIRFCVQRHNGISMVYYDRGYLDSILKKSRPVDFLSKGLRTPSREFKGRVAGKDFAGHMWDTKSLKQLVWTDEVLRAFEYLC